LTAGSMWFMRNQSLFEMWWLFTTLMRYPREVLARGWFEPVGRFFTYVIPILLGVNVPARVVVGLLGGGVGGEVGGVAGVGGVGGVWGGGDGGDAVRQPAVLPVRAAAVQECEQLAEFG